MDESAYLNTDIFDGILYITFNRPDKHNCFGTTELQKIKKVLAEKESNPNVKAVVFKGAGSRSFSTGADLKQFTKLNKPGTVQWIKTGHVVFNQIDSYPKPTLAVIQGYALGGGLELALSCDLRIASDKAIFGSPELRHGWLPGWGGIHRLKKIVGQAKTKEILFIGEQITAVEALQIGLINKMTTYDQLDQKTDELLENLTKLEPDAFSLAKAAISSQGLSDYPTPSEIWFDVLSTLYSRNLTS